ncbi:hypothetical protein F4808DRAFT_423651 [Astrocystis sublimbata]|nr:hypothetical protein F4808DRAFT_423651 [Astrocystis sublimbata]
MVLNFSFSCSLVNDSLVIKQEAPGFKYQPLSISFQRTVRVPDNTNDVKLPPGLGQFPLFKVSDFASKLPADIGAKGGVFFPMYQREAMWINFNANRPFMIKIYAGGVNAVSGENQGETLDTKARRLDLVSNKKSVQDYVVVPGQRWIDGFAVSPGTVRQFVAMPLGTGYTVEAQLTGQEIVGGLQLEITPSLPEKRVEPTRVRYVAGTEAAFTVKSMTGKEIPLRFPLETTIEQVKEGIQAAEGIPSDQQRLLYDGKALHDDCTLGDYGIKSGSIVHITLTLRGGGYSGPMGVAAGGKIDQVIHEDHNEPSVWAKTTTITIPVHILSTTMFRHVTGRQPTACPISASDYASVGLPFFNLPEEPSNISGAFDGVKSVNEIKVDRGLASGLEPTVTPQVVTIGQGAAGTSNNYVDPETINDPHGLVNPSGPLLPFRTLRDLQDQLKEDDVMEV